MESSAFLVVAPWLASRRDGCTATSVSTPVSHKVRRERGESKAGSKFPACLPCRFLRRCRHCAFMPMIVLLHFPRCCVAAVLDTPRCPLECDAAYHHRRACRRHYLGHNAVAQRRRGAASLRYAAQLRGRPLQRWLVALFRYRDAVGPRRLPLPPRWDLPRFFAMGSGHRTVMPARARATAFGPLGCGISDSHVRARASALTHRRALNALERKKVSVPGSTRRRSGAAWNTCRESSDWLENPF